VEYLINITWAHDSRSEIMMNAIFVVCIGFSVIGVSILQRSIIKHSTYFYYRILYDKLCSMITHIGFRKIKRSRKSHRKSRFWFVWSGRHPEGIPIEGDGKVQRSFDKSSGILKDGREIDLGYGSFSGRILKR